MEIRKIYSSIAENGTRENLIQILQAISPYVIVTGSYAYGKQRKDSDIDLFIRGQPEEDIDPEEDFVEDTYTKPLIRFFESMGYQWGSVFVDSFHVDDTYIPLEFSAFYDIEDETFPIEILGVTMTAAKSRYTSEKYLNGEKRGRTKSL